jgi:hypothetical protein
MFVFKEIKETFRIILLTPRSVVELILTGTMARSQENDRNFIIPRFLLILT